MILPVVIGSSRTKAGARTMVTSGTVDMRIAVRLLSMRTSPQLISVNGMTLPNSPMMARSSHTHEARGQRCPRTATIRSRTIAPIAIRSRHPDRNAQFEHINGKVLAAQAKGHPVISVDTKKKELVGNDKNGGTDWRPKGSPVRVKVHDFEDKALGKVVPYGVYDIGANEGFVSLGITADTAQFAVEAIRSWIARMGRTRYPKMRELTITADCGGSNGARIRLWKVELQKLADETRLTIHVHHYPPGTSKWNKIEHRLFCHITQNWRGKPLTDRLAIVELIGATTTKAGLTIECVLDERTYEKASRSRTARWTRSTSPAMTSIVNGITRSSRGTLQNRSDYRCGCPKHAHRAGTGRRRACPSPGGFPGRGDLGYPWD
jgi:hypothetical protein